jgi:hypothetical protein
MKAFLFPEGLWEWDEWDEPPAEPLLFRIARPIMLTCATIAGGAAACSVLPDQAISVAEQIAAHEEEQAASMRRISLDGTDYGSCLGLILTVYLDPEPCEALGETGEEWTPVAAGD